MADPFFPDVTAPIRFAGLESRDALAFKVYQPDHMVLGKRMEDHLRPACASGTRSHGRAWTCSGWGRSTGRGSAAR